MDNRDPVDLQQHSGRANATTCAMLVAKFVPKHRAGFVDIVIANIGGEDIRKALRRFRFRFTFFLQSATLASSHIVNLGGKALVLQFGK